MRLRSIASPALGGILICLSSAASADQKNLYENVTASPDLTIFLSALEESERAGILKAKSGGTVFAPTDEAWKKLGDEELTRLIADKEKLRKIVLNHIVEGKILTQEQLKARTGEKENEFIISTTDGLKIGPAKLIGKEVRCSNGILHTIDAVLIAK